MSTHKDTVSLTVVTKDIQLSHAPNSSPLSIIASHTTSSDEVIRKTLQRLQIYEDSSLYRLVTLDKSGDITHAFSATDYPLVVMEKEGTLGMARCLFVRKRVSVSASLLSSLTDSVSALSSDSLEALAEIDDLCQLDDLSEDLMLSILRSRFESNRIYTYVGSILIAINPYYFYSIYNPKYCSLYQGKRLGELAPHVFAIADDSYSSMLSDKVDQAVIISGESGAGKTESTKFLLHQLMQLSAKYEETSSLDLITLGTGPVLEAFGNAKTIANNNSSRFGKFILVKFKENGAYYGASIEKYLLEKSRIISQAPGERNYHVFYYLLSGADSALKNKLHLLSLDEYRYLRQPELTEVRVGDEAAEFQRLRESLSMLKFTEDIQISMFTVLSAILHIGNIKFEKIDSGGERVQILNLDTVQVISQLLRVDQDILIEALVTRKAKAGGIDSFVTHYKLDEAVATCDAMAKALYGALFDWIVDKVNGALVGQYAKGPHKGNTIGVLDIFGFEVFPKNSFEQFCINYANEQLQQYFNKHIFKLEQVEYESEGIEWRSVKFEDNSECIDLIAKKPTGLLPLLDEECSFPGADDLSLFEKFERQHKGSSSHYSSPQLKKKEPVFTISHYASPVTYSIQGFREKNRDLMRQDVVEVLKTSHMDLVRSLIGLHSYAAHKWRIIISTVYGAVRFRRCGSERRRRKQEEEDYHRASGYTRKKRPVSSPPSSPDHESKSVIQRVHSAGNMLSTEEKSNSKGKSGGHKLSALYEPFGGDQTDSALPPPPALSPNLASTERHPSIAHLFKKKWHHSLRARMEGKLERDELALLTTSTGGGGIGGAVSPSKDKAYYKSAPRVKIDGGRSAGGKLQQLAGSSRRGQTKTVSAEFHASLVYLMEQLERTHPYFIRCIKSNGVKASREFDSELVTRQLRYTGMMETIRIRKAGFSVRMTFEDFYEKYQFLIGRKETDLANQIRVFLERLGFSSSDVQMGNTKVFMRDRQKHILQDLLEEKVLSKIILIQRWTRAKLYRCRFLHTKRTALLIQRYSRGYLARLDYSHFRRKVCSAVIIQSAWRCYYHKRNFMILREAAIALQAYWRGRVARKSYLEALEKKREEERRRIEEQRREIQRIKEEKEKEERRLAEERKREEEKLLEELVSLETEVTEQQTQEDLNSTVMKEFDDIISDLTSTDSQASLPQATPSQTEATPTNDTTTPTKSVAGSESKSITEATPTTKPDEPTNSKHLPSKEGDIKATPNSSTPSRSSKNVIDMIGQFSGNSSDDVPGPVKLSRKTPVGRIKSPFLEMEARQSATPSPDPSRGSNENLIMTEDDVPSNPDTAAVDRAPPLVLETRTTPIKEAPAVHKKPQRQKDKTGHASSSQNHTHNQKPEDEDLLLDSLSDEDFDITMTRKEGGAGNAHKEPMRRGITRSLGDATDLEDRTNVTPPTCNSSSSTHLASSLHLTEALKSQSFDETCELTRGLSPDDIYHVNYQMRHDLYTSSPESVASEDTSPGHDKENRFVVTKKRWGRRSPKLGFKGKKDGGLGGGSGGGHPLLSKIQRIASPVTSGETTPTSSLSPMKKSSSMQRHTVQVVHSFKTSSMNKSQVCMVCSKAFSGFLKQGSKCVTCGILIHKHCQNRAPLCNEVLRPGQQVIKATEIVVSDTDELDELARFLVVKHQLLLQQLSQKQDRTEPLDRMFQSALCEFQYNLLSSYSLTVQESSDTTPTTTNGHITPTTPIVSDSTSSSSLSSSSSKNNKGSTPSPVTYTVENLVNKFSSIYRSMGDRENRPLDSSDVAVGVNHIRTILDEFVKSRYQRVRVLSNDSKMRPAKLKRRKSASKDVHVRTHKGHKFALTQFNVRTVCDQCSDLIPVLAKGEMCQECSFACHESCTKKVSLKCEGKGWSRGGAAKTKVANQVSSKSQFGAPLESLVPAGAVKVPTFLEKCFLCIENNGLYTQGIYRRSAGGSSKRAVREALENDPEGVDMDNFSLYAVAATVTSFFRELPEPLLTHQLYNDFIRATDLSDVSDMMETLHRIIDCLPDLNHCVFERLIFNLARVAQQGSVNKMDPHNLAIIFAPTLLQDSSSANPDQLLKMMPKQTKVIESIINEQLDKLAVTLKGIHDLTSVAKTAADRLSKLQEETPNEVKSPTPSKKMAEAHVEQKKESDGSKDGPQTEATCISGEKERLKKELKLIERDRAVLTASLPKLEPFPNHTLCNRTETNLPSSLVTSSAQNNSIHITGTGREEFLKRQSMFTRGGVKGEDVGKDKHHSCVIRVEGVEKDKETTAKVDKEEKKKEEGEVEEEINEVEKEEEKDLLPELPVLVTLSSLTKNRISQKPFIKRRPPTHHHLINQSNSSLDNGDTQ